MIIIYESVRTGAELDRLTIDDTGTVTNATTGKGRLVVETLLRRHGTTLGLQALRSWSNGAVLTREVPDTSD